MKVEAVTAISIEDGCCLCSSFYVKAISDIFVNANAFVSREDLLS
jgi:hypothetical protein